MSLDTTSTQYQLLLLYHYCTQNKLKTLTRDKQNILIHTKNLCKIIEQNWSIIVLTTRIFFQIQIRLFLEQSYIKRNIPEPNWDQWNYVHRTVYNKNDVHNLLIAIVFGMTWNFDKDFISTQWPYLNFL